MSQREREEREKQEGLLNDMKYLRILVTQLY